MQTISIRVPDEDFQWLLSSAEPGAKTPSEKLRALVTKARQQEAGMENYRFCAAWMRGLTQPFVDAVTALERKEKIHSDVVAAALEWVPQIMAILASERPGGTHPRDSAVEIEAALAQQSFRLLAALLRAGVTSVPAAYDNEVFGRYLPEIIEIAEIISTRKEKESKNG